MLRFAVELLLAPDDESGPLAPVPKPVRSIARPGATLLDLALENRIDTDRIRLTLLDAALLDDDLPDAALRKSPPLTPPILTLPGLPIFLDRPHRPFRPRHPSAHPPPPPARRANPTSFPTGRCRAGPPSAPPSPTTWATSPAAGAVTVVVANCDAGFRLTPE